MINKILALKDEAIKRINETKSINELNETKALYLGKKSPIQEIMSKMREFTPEEKKEIGMKVNEFKVAIEQTVNSRLEAINEEEVKQMIDELVKKAKKASEEYTKLNQEQIDKISHKNMERVFMEVLK